MQHLRRTARNYFRNALEAKWSTQRWIWGLYENARLGNLDTTNVSLPPSPSSPINIVHQVRAGEGVIYNLCSGNTANLDKHVCELPDFPRIGVVIISTQSEYSLKILAQTYLPWVWVSFARRDPQVARLDNRRMTK